MGKVIIDKIISAHPGWDIVDLAIANRVWQGNFESGKLVFSPVVAWMFFHEEHSEIIIQTYPLHAGSAFSPGDSMMDSNIVLRRPDGSFFNENAEYPLETEADVLQFLTDWILEDDVK